MEVRNLILANMLGVGLVVSASVLYACSCAGTAAPFDGASEVFIGKVSKIYRPLLEKIGITKTYTDRVVFRVTKLWRGPVSKTKIVATRLQTESCGYPFEMGKEYLVVVMRGRDVETGICTGTKNIEDAKQDIQQLDKSYKTLQGKRK